MTGRLETWLARSWLVATLAAALVALGVAIVVGNPGLLAIAVLGFALTAALCRTLGRADAGIAFALFGWALALRLLIVAVLSLVSAEYVAGGLLSPDGTGYMKGSNALVQSGFAVGPPFTFFGTYDIGQFYVFAAVMKAFGSGFLVLAAFNAAVGAMAAPVAFAWARLAAPRHGVLIGAVAALSPSLVLLSTTNLLKDPLVILGTLVVAFSVAQALRAQRVGVATWPWLAACALTLAFLHTTRFYVAAYLELGLIIVVAVGLLRTRSRPQRPGFAAAVVGTILVAEILAGAIGWPSSPDMIASQVQHVTTTPALQPVLEKDDQGNRVPGLATAVDVARRIFGPYVWVPPQTLDLKYLVLADFDLYTDTFLWYVILPFLAVGLAFALSWVGRKTLNGAMDIGYLAIFVSIYLAQYLAINLSYRQREDVLLVALGFVPAGARWMLSKPLGRTLYAGYWVVLVVVAVSHLILRARS